MTDRNNKNDNQPNIKKKKQKEITKNKSKTFPHFMHDERKSHKVDN